MKRIYADRLRFAAGFFAAVFLAALFSPVRVFAAPNVSAKSAIVMNASTGEILFEKNADDRTASSGTAKITAGLLAVEYGHFTQYVTMSYNSIWGFDRTSAHIALDVDEIVTFEQLLYGMMLASANDCAIGIAETVSGSTDGFVAKMNEKARELGALSTHYVSPCGTDDGNDFTTARDAAVIMREAIGNETLLGVMSTLQYTIPPTNKQKENRVFNNTHKMLPGREYYYSATVCGKTGWTAGSGNSVVTYARENGVELIAVVFGENSPQAAYKDTANLFDFFFDNYEMRRFFVKEELAGELTEIELACAGTVKCVADGSISVLFEKGAAVGNVACAVTPDNTLSLPVIKGQKIGTVRFTADGRFLGEVPVYAAETMYVRSDEEIPDNIPDDRKGVSIIDRKDKSAFGKFLIITGYIITAVVVITAVLAVIALCIRQQNIRKLQRRKMTRKRSGELDKKKPFSDTPYGRK